MLRLIAPRQKGKGANLGREAGRDKGGGKEGFIPMVTTIRQDGGQ